MMALLTFTCAVSPSTKPMLRWVDASALPFNLSAGDSARMRRGQAIPWTGAAGQRLRMFSGEQDFLGIGTMTAEGMLQAQRLVAEKHAPAE